jgi:hypothetical protein
LEKKKEKKEKQRALLGGIEVLCVIENVAATRKPDASMIHVSSGR